MALATCFLFQTTKRNEDKTEKEKKSGREKERKNKKQMLVQN